MTQTTEASQTVRDIETELAAPHDLGCFEEYAELAVEQGLSTEGEYDEILSDGVTLMGSFHRDLRTGAAKCTCQVTVTAEMLEDGW